MVRKVTLTPARIDALVNGEISDPHTPGLSIRARAKGRHTWRYRRQLADGSRLLLSLGRFPAFSIAAAREWANDLNAKIDQGIDPRAEGIRGVERSKVTIALAHGRYMAAVRDGRASRAKKVNKPGTIRAKLEIYNCDIAPKLGTTVIYDVTEDDLAKLVLAKGRKAKVRANRLANELKVFFGWASSLRGKEISLPSNPAARLADLKFPEAPRERKLSLDEIGWFLRSLALEPRVHQRALLLCLLTAARISEVIEAKSSEFRSGVWTIPAARTKNSRAHRIALGPWGASLVRSNSDWIFPSDRIDGPRVACGFYKARNRVLASMSELAGRPIEKWTPHDLRRTARSNTKRLKVDFETAEAMLNHCKQGLERIYDGYDLEDEKRAWFLAWEGEIIRIAHAVGVAEALGVPHDSASTNPSGSKLPWAVPRRNPTGGRGTPSRRARRRA